MKTIPDQLSMMPPLQPGEDAEDLTEQVRHAQEYARLKRNWENAFQRWSNEQGMDGYHSYGCCGYSPICDYCSDNSYGRPCVRALNLRCREKHILVDYSKRNFEEIWRG